MTATAAEVLAAARAYVEADNFGGVLEIDHTTMHHLAAALGISYSQLESYEIGRLTSQARRAFTILSDEGALLKSLRGMDLPEGGRSATSRYYTYAAWQEAKKRKAERDAAERATDEEWAAIHARLNALGIGALWSRTGSGWASTDLAGWDRLLSLAEASRELPTHVRFAHPENGYDAAQDNMKRAGFELGQVYTIRSLHVGQSSSYVELYEVRGQFGSEFFETYNPDGD